MVRQSACLYLMMKLCSFIIRLMSSGVSSHSRDLEWLEPRSQCGEQLSIRQPRAATNPSGRTLPSLLQKQPVAPMARVAATKSTSVEQHKEQAARGDEGQELHNHGRLRCEGRSRRMPTDIFLRLILTRPVVGLLVFHRVTKMTRWLMAPATACR